MELSVCEFSHTCSIECQALVLKYIHVHVPSNPVTVWVEAVSCSQILHVLYSTRGRELLWHVYKTKIKKARVVCSQGSRCCYH